MPAASKSPKATPAARHRKALRDSSERKLALARSAKDDPLRGTGRTTGLMLLAIGGALTHQGQWVDFIDHFGRGFRHQRVFASRLRSLCQSLGLSCMDVKPLRNKVQIKSFLREE